MSAKTSSAWLRVAPLVAVIVAAILGLTFLRDVVSFDALRDNRERLIAYRDAHYLQSVALFVAAYVLIVAFSLPGATVATLTGGFLFGVFPGVFYNVLAATIGATGIFLAVKSGFGERLAARMKASDGAVKRFKDGIDDNQWSALFLIRLLPAVPFFVANILPAMFGVSLSRFVLSTFFGIMPGTLILTSVGAGLGDVFENGETPDLRFLVRPEILLPILGLCLIAALPVILKLLNRRKGA